MNTSKTRQGLRLLGASLVVVAAVLIGTLHAVGYREALARVEDYVTAFRQDIPGALEPYGSNTLLKTTQVRYNDAVYQLSFSSTSASPEEVMEGYSKALTGPALVESTAGGKVLSLYHSDGRTLTMVRAMPHSPDSSETIVQKLHTVKVGPSRETATAPEAAELAPLLARVQEAASTPEEGRRQAMGLLQEMLPAMAEVRAEELRRAMPREDRPGFDVPSVPRFPGSVRVSAVALEDGKIRIVRYLADADAEMVMRFYQHALEAEGWQADAVSAIAAEQSNGAQQQHRLYSNAGGTSLNLIATPSSRAGLTSITAMVQ